MRKCKLVKRTRKTMQHLRVATMHSTSIREIHNDVGVTLACARRRMGSTVQRVSHHAKPQGAIAALARHADAPMMARFFKSEQLWTTTVTTRVYRVKIVGGPSSMVDKAG